ncbi:MAG: hypothetical protein V1836_00185 [Candidatus Aenigmatarchaeota archaeon]
MTVHSAKSELYVPERGVKDVVLDVAGKLKLGNNESEKIARLAADIERNDRLPSYRSSRIKGNSIVLECYETDYATNLAMLKGEIPSESVKPICVIGIPELRNGVEASHSNPAHVYRVLRQSIAVGKVNKAYSTGKLQGIPAGLVNINELDSSMSPLASFYNELFEETGLKDTDVDSLKFIGMVYDMEHSQLALAYRYDTNRNRADFEKGMATAKDRGEYGELHTIEVTSIPTDLVGFVIKENNALSHCKGAVALYAIDKFLDYHISDLLVGKQGKLFSCFK